MPCHALKLSGMAGSGGPHVAHLTSWCGQARSVVRKDASVARRCRPTGVSGRRWYCWQASPTVGVYTKGRISSA